MHAALSFQRGVSLRDGAQPNWIEIADVREHFSKFVNL
jgi:hypothetical protein